MNHEIEHTNYIRFEFYPDDHAPTSQFPDDSKCHGTIVCDANYAYRSRSTQLFFGTATNLFGDSVDISHYGMRVIALSDDIIVDAKDNVHTTARDDSHITPPYLLSANCLSVRNC